MSQRTPRGHALMQILVAVATLLASASGIPLLAAADAQVTLPADLVFLVAPEGQYAQLSEALDATGARILHEFPPDALIAEGGSGLAEQAVASGWALYATTEAVSDQAQESLSPGARRAAGVWNSLRTTPPVSVPRGLDAPVGDARRPPDIVELGPQALDPSLYQQSEYLIGKVAVNLVLVESDGSVDASTEDWTPDRQQQVFEQIVQAMSWWQAREPRARLQFVYQDYYSTPVPVSYEPVSRPHYEDRLWISQAMQRLGFGHSSYITATRLLNRDTRERHDADWAFTVFVVDSLNDADNLFTDGYFAYAYIHGPYMVMTYGNNGYGPSHMGAVAAHEVGHIFGALDEYAAANVPPSTVSGYLGVPNGNSKPGGTIDVGCIMRGGIEPYVLQQLCPFTAGQVGWRDSDGDGILDPVDTEVQVELSVSAGDNGVRLVGSAIEVPCPTPLRQPISINHIAYAHFRVNDGPWRVLPPADGHYNSAAEVLDYLLPPAPSGSWTIEVRAGNNDSGLGSAAGSLQSAGSHSPLPEILVEGALSSTGGNSQAALVGVVTAPEGAGHVVAIEHQLDGQPWVSIPAEDGSLDEPVERFTLTLDGLAPGGHKLCVRAAAQNPWVECQEWEQPLTIAWPPEQTPPTDSEIRICLPALSSSHQ